MTATIQDKVVWAFNPVYIDISGVGRNEDDETDRVFVEVQAYNDGEKVSLEPQVFGTTARVNISGAIRMQFKHPETERGKTITVRVTDSKKARVDLEVFAIWGTLRYGDRCYQYGYYVVDDGRAWYERRLQHFVNFPFTVNLLHHDSANMKVRYGRGRYVDVATKSQGQGGLYTLAEYTVGSGKELDGLGQRTCILQQGGESENPLTKGTAKRVIDPFDLTFDYTFHPLAAFDTRTVLEPRTEREGVYLRWVDDFGFIEYYLFATSKRTQKLSLSKNEVQARVQGTSMGYIFTRNQEITSEDSYDICAVNLDKDTLRYVESVLTSPVTDMYRGKDAHGVDVWEPVKIAAKSCKYNINHQYLTDLEFTITRQKRYGQSL